MFSEISALIRFIDQNSDLKSLILKMQESADNFWLVGGCLRNFLLDLPQVDIDIACSGNPTGLTQAWASEVSGHWFWLDSKRKQSRVLLSNGLTVDFSPLRASTIIEDLKLRDFTINSLALSLDKTFPVSELLDPLSGLKQLKNNQIQACSPRSFIDDPLRMLKGIRHATTLKFEFSSDTLEQIGTSAHLLTYVAGERIQDELGKILSSDNAVKGIELLIDSTLLEVLFGPAGNKWNLETSVCEINQFNVKIQSLPESSNTEIFSTHAVFLFARLLKFYEPNDLSELLHERLRLSRYHQHLLEELQNEPDLALFHLASSITGQRRQALLVERMEPFAAEKMLYWGVCGEHLKLKKVKELMKSFADEQKLGRIPDLLNGKVISALLKVSQSAQIGEWQTKLKLAEINSEISTFSQAQNWLKNKLSFDNKEA